MGKFSLLAALGILALLSVARAMPQPSSDSSSEELVEARELMEEGTWIRKTVEESPDEILENYYVMRPYQSSDEGNNDQTEAMKAAKICAKTAADLENFMSAIDTLSNDTRTAFVSQYCPQLERTALCMIDVVKASRPFVEEDDFTIVKAVADNYPDAVDLICKNDGEMIFKLADPTTKKCFKKLCDDVMERTALFADEVKHWDISHLTQTQCEAYTGLRQYIEGKLNVCKIPDLMSVYDLFYNTLFSVTTCRNYVRTVEADLLAVTRATPQSGSDSSSGDSVDSREIKQESPETSGFMDDIRVTIRNNSESDEAHDDETEAMKAAKMCAKTAIDFENFMSDIDTLSNETRTAFVSQYCPRLEKTALCMIDVVKASRPFVEEDEFTIFKALADNYPDAVDLICKNDGEMIFNLAEPFIKKCVEKLCDDVVERMERWDIENEHWDISHLTQTQCEVYSGLREYIERKLNVCKIPDLMSVYDLFHNTLFRVTTCRNYVPTLMEIENQTVNEN